MSYYIALMMGASMVAFAAWAVIFRDQQRIRLVVTSLWLFALPILVLVLDNHTLGLLWSIPYVVLIFFEEVLKLAGSRMARNNREAFSLVFLFGLWELAITKPVGVLFQNPQFFHFLDENYAKYSLVSSLSLLMHSTTAAIYALLRNSNWLIPFSLALVLHLVFNYTRDFYFYEETGQIKIHFSLIFGDTAFFVLAWLVIWVFYRRSQTHQLRITGELQ